MAGEKPAATKTLCLCARMWLHRHQGFGSIPGLHYLRFQSTLTHVPVALLRTCLCLLYARHVLSWNFESVRDLYDGCVPDLMRTSNLEVAMYLSYCLVALVPYVAASKCLLVTV